MEPYLVQVKNAGSVLMANGKILGFYEPIEVENPKDIDPKEIACGNIIISNQIINPHYFPSFSKLIYMKRQIGIAVNPYISH